MNRRIENNERNARVVLEFHNITETMKDWVACFDGTRNREKTGTNIYRLYKFLRQDEGQEAVYFPGVGTTPGEWARGLLFGWGLSRQIKSAYGWLAERWREGDRIWVFGFSRGAYAVRSLAGMLEMRGIPDGADAGKAYEGNRRGERTGRAEVWVTGVFDIFYNRFCAIRTWVKSLPGGA